jgi:hypothetical protein
MDRYFVFVRKQDKWKKHDYAEINARVQFQSGLESKVEFKGKIILHLMKKEV